LRRRTIATCLKEFPSRPHCFVAPLTYQPSPPGPRALRARDLQALSSALLTEISAHPLWVSQPCTSTHGQTHWDTRHRLRDAGCMKHSLMSVFCHTPSSQCRPRSFTSISRLLAHLGIYTLTAGRRLMTLQDFIMPNLHFAGMMHTLATAAPILQGTPFADSSDSKLHQ